MKETFPKKENIGEEKERVENLTGIDFVFSENPHIKELALKYAGNDLEKAKEIYGEYIETIFPDSKIKSIVYHGGPEGIEVFDKNAKSFDNIEGRSRGRFFTGIRNLAKVYAEKAQIIHGNAKVYAAVLNVQNPVLVKDKSKLDELLYPNNDSIIHESFLQTTEIEEIVVFNPNQIHVLGSKKDEEMFENFLVNYNLS